MLSYIVTARACVSKHKEQVYVYVKRQKIKYHRIIYVGQICLAATSCFLILYHYISTI